MMKHSLIPALGLVLALASPAQAACIATYKAKMEDPLRLDYGEVSVASATCTRDGVRDAVSAILAARGWILLTIVSVQEGRG